MFGSKNFTLSHPPQLSPLPWRSRLSSVAFFAEAKKKGQPE
jgi:hypothetical protein